MNDQRLHLELHIIQNFAPSNLNRDDVGSPKECAFGGVRRARISSQALKRAMRKHKSFQEAVREAGGDIGVRTRQLKNELTKKLTAKGINDQEELSRLVEFFIGKALGLKFAEKNPDNTQYLLYIGKGDIDNIVAILYYSRETIIKENKAKAVPEELKRDIRELKNSTSKSIKRILQVEDDMKKKIKDLKDELSEELLRKKISDSDKDKRDKLADFLVEEAIVQELKKKLKELVSSKNKAYAADIALFGRMVADDKAMNVDASCQVAHSISTHQVETEIDYFTAVDDLKAMDLEDDAGAGMIGQVELNGSCHYRYLNVDILSLCENLGFNRDLTAATVSGLIAAAALAIPTGKQNSTAAQNPPHYIKAILREDGQLWSLAGAFSKPVRILNNQSRSYEEESVSRLEDYFQKLNTAYGAPKQMFDQKIELGSQDGTSLEKLREAVVAAINKRITDRSE